MMRLNLFAILALFGCLLLILAPGLVINAMIGVFVLVFGGRWFLRAASASRRRWWQR